MFRSILLVMVVTVISPLSSVHGQDSEEVKRLKERIELLEAKLKLAEKEVELLKKEQAMLNANDTKKPAPAPESGEDAFAFDAVLTGRRTMGEEIKRNLSTAFTSVNTATRTKLGAVPTRLNDRSSRPTQFGHQYPGRGSNPQPQASEACTLSN